MKSAGTGASKSARPAAKKKSGGGMLVGVFIGLILGVVAALGVALYINKTPMPFNKTQTTLDSKAPAESKGGKPPVPVALPGKPGDPLPGGNKPAEQAAAAAAPAAEAAPAKPGDKAADKAADKAGDKPRFDFYKILPGNAEALPEPKAEGKREVKDAVAKEPVFLQAGSFQKSNDAEGVKANLALIGLDASVQQVMVQDKVWYRVRLGPYAKTEEANRVRAELARSGIEATLVKNKE
jgi:cell division protein FtsN